MGNRGWVGLTAILVEDEKPHLYWILNSSPFIDLAILAYENQFVIQICNTVTKRYFLYIDSGCDSNVVC